MGSCCDNARARHDFEMAAHDAVEFQRLRIEGNKAEIAGCPDGGAAHRVGQHAADVKRLGNQHDDQRRQQRKARQEDEALMAS